MQAREKQRPPGSARRRVLLILVAMMPVEPNMSLDSHLTLSMCFAGQSLFSLFFLYVCMCVCVCARGCVCVCVRVRPSCSFLVWQ